MKLTLAEVLDSGIILQGKFSQMENGAVEKKFFRLNDIISIKRVSGGHTLFRIFGGFLIFTGVIGSVSWVSDSPPQNGLAAVTLLSFSSIGSIPFLIPRRNLSLGDKWELIIRP